MLNPVPGPLPPANTPVLWWNPALLRWSVGYIVSTSDVAPGYPVAGLPPWGVPMNVYSHWTDLPPPPPAETAKGVPAGTLDDPLEGEPD